MNLKTRHIREGGIVMKRIIIVFLVSTFIMGCSAIKQEITKEEKMDGLIKILAKEKKTEKIMEYKDIQLLEEEVSNILIQDNVTRRTNIDKVFLLADIYLEQQKEKEAKKLYEIALAADSWRLESQLKYAQILSREQNTKQAVEKMMFLYQYAEDEELIKKAEKLLFELKENIVDEKENIASKSNNHIEIVMVPVGNVNQRLLNELIRELQAKMGIKYSIADKELELKNPERKKSIKFINTVYKTIKKNLPVEEEKELFDGQRLQGKVTITYDDKIELIRKYFEKYRTPKEYTEEFERKLKLLENSGQYDVERLKTMLGRTFKLSDEKPIKGYLGITEGDIYADDYNFLFGQATTGFAVMSYHRFRAAFNNETSNRKRLLNRTLKQAISSSFFILGIKRCTTPTCARAYPHSLDEQDRKEIEICPWCLEKLNKYIDLRR
jgi:predicted Zn-dependent protease